MTSKQTYNISYKVATLLLRKKKNHLRIRSISLGVNGREVFALLDVDVDSLGVGVVQIPQLNLAPYIHSSIPDMFNSC